jgi:hypothetical protein
VKVDTDGRTVDEIVEEIARLADEAWVSVDG